jgi:hypothetical protein
VTQLPLPGPALSGDDVTLQLGSFGERDNARRLAQRLEDAGIDDVDVDHVEIDGRDLWRVRVGPIAARDPRCPARTAARAGTARAACGQGLDAARRIPFSPRTLGSAAGVPALRLARFFLAAASSALVAVAAAQTPLPQPGQPAAAVMPVPPAPVPTGAKAWLLMDFDTGQILAGQNIDARMEPASITKVMTSYVVNAEMKNGKIKPDDLVTISERAWREGGAGTEGSFSGFELNSRNKLTDVEKGMSVQSGQRRRDRAGRARRRQRGAFAALMNSYAARIGMKNSHFTNAHGLSDPNHYSTAHDLALMGRAMIRDFPEAYSYNALKEYTVGSITQHNRNGLLWREAAAWTASRPATPPTPATACWPRPSAATSASSRS